MSCSLPLLPLHADVVNIVGLGLFLDLLWGAQIRGYANFPSLSSYDTGILLFGGVGVAEDTCVRQNWRGWEERSGRAEGDASSGKLGAGSWRGEILEFSSLSLLSSVCRTVRTEVSWRKHSTLTQPRSLCGSAAQERNRRFCATTEGGRRRSARLLFPLRWQKSGQRGASQTLYSPIVYSATALGYFISF